MGKLEKLTPDQEAMLPVIRDKWINRALYSGGETDIESAYRFMDFIYEKASLESPIKILVDSPMGAQLAVPLIKSLPRAQVGAQVGDQVRDQVRDQVWDQVWAQVGDQVRDQVGAQVRDQVWAQVGAQVRDQVWAQVRDQVWAQEMGYEPFSNYANFSRLWMDIIL